MTVAQMLEKLAQLPKDAVILMEAGGGLSMVSELHFVEGSGPGAPPEVILQPNMDE
jgi:hypothetical protein